MRRILFLLAFFLHCDGVGPYAKQTVATAMLGVGLRKDFLLGTATAPHQVEGGNSNDWSDWEATSFPDGTPHIKNGDQSGRADDSWNLWRDDLAAMQTLGVNAYRLGIEWSRVEPVEGSFDAAALANYKDMFTALRQAGIEPVVTLFHFTLPKWFAARGGFESPDAIATFASFVTRMATEYGALVDTWVTVNEPNVYALEAYSLGVFPPGVKDSKRQTKVFATLLKAHAAAATALRQNDTTDANGDGAATFIGLAHHVRVFQPASAALLDETIAGLSDDYFNEAVPRAAHTGRIMLSIPGTISIDERVDELRDSFDYLGLNYYTRDFIRADLGDPTLSKQYVPAGRPVSDLGWDIYPEGFQELLIRFSRYGWPIIVTENGIADRADAARGDFLRAHMYALQQAVKAGADVRGYLHWSLIDNFEWAEGFNGRFGLFAVDFSDPTRARVPRASVSVFQEIAKNVRAAQ